jgi:hypothetical protein
MKQKSETFVIDADLHQRLFAYSVNNGITVDAAVNDFIEKGLTPPESALYESESDESKPITQHLEINIVGAGLRAIRFRACAEAEFDHAFYDFDVVGRPNEIVVVRLHTDPDKDHAVLYDGGEAGIILTDHISELVKLIPADVYPHLYEVHGSVGLNVTLKVLASSEDEADEFANHVDSEEWIDEADYSGLAIDNIHSYKLS